jgi:hypothetical protein
MPKWLMRKKDVSVAARSSPGPSTSMTDVPLTTKKCKALSKSSKARSNIAITTRTYSRLPHRMCGRPGGCGNLYGRSRRLIFLNGE